MKLFTHHEPPPRAEVTLHVKGDLEVLRLQPGDTIVCTIDEKYRLPADHIEQLKEKLRERFPNHEAVVVDGGLRLSAQREEAA